MSSNVCADPCTPPPSAVTPTLTSQVSFDKKSQSYKYGYTVKNGVNAQIALDWFGILVNQAPSSFLSAANWSGGNTQLNFMPYRFDWSTAKVTGAAGKKITGDGTLTAPTYALKPGSSLSGFELTSSQPPGPVQFFATGFAQPPSSIPTTGDDEPTPSCPGWDFNNAQLLTQVTGIATGPLDPDTISLKLRARDETGIKPCAPINPKAPSGKIAVLILSTKSFDASQINVSSLMFGPAFVAPSSSKLLPAGIGEDLGHDERADWERVFEQFFGSENRHKSNPRPQNLLLTFDIASLDVQCNLDQALFLRGTTTSGQQVVGAVSSNLTGCGPTDFGKHQKHKIPHRWWPQKVSNQP
jgi:hypothetical protein